MWRIKLCVHNVTSHLQYLIILTVIHEFKQIEKSQKNVINLNSFVNNSILTTMMASLRINIIFII